MTKRFARLITHLLALTALIWSGTAWAEVHIHFHSINGSVVFGSRYPHAFIVLDGTLADGRTINENYGFSARRANLSVLNGPVEHMVLSETERTVRRTNRHFSLTISDEQYFRIIEEVHAWQNAPGKYYDLETRNCIHFVGTMAQILGLRVDYPEKMLRRPKKWLNHITELNPQLGAEVID